MYCHDILALDAIVHSASLSLCLDSSSSSSSSQTHTTHSMSVDAPFLKVLKFARVCNGMRETTAKPVSYRGMYETYASTARVNLITALSIHPRSSSPSPTRIIIILIRILFFIFLYCILSPDAGDQDVHCPSLSFPFDQAARVRVGVQLLLENNLKLHSNNKITLDEAMQ